jgi:uncharacterized phage protein (TIGR01671 family)
MRESKFRGFNKKNGVWLYGFYLQNRGAHFVCPDEFADGKSWDDYEIDPESRGEWTGLKDKKCSEIYEGDIVMHPYVDPIFGDFVEGKDGEGVISEVVYNGASFAVKHYDRCYYLEEFTRHNHIEVVGKVYENPELLK